MISIPASLAMFLCFGKSCQRLLGGKADMSLTGDLICVEGLHYAAMTGL